MEKNLSALYFPLFLHSQNERAVYKSLDCEADDSVAQLVEQYTFNVWVLGSSPSGITKSTIKAL
jgi:hypothetical protein